MSVFYLEPILIDDVSAEADRARAKFGDQYQLNDFEWLAVVTEEVGEAANVLNEIVIDRTRKDPLDIGYAPEERRAQLRAEVVQIAATAARWLAAMDEQR